MRRTLTCRCCCLVLPPRPQWTPSQLIAGLQHPGIHAASWRPKPQIIELLGTDAVSVLLHAMQQVQVRC
jgi:hypothetical protein